MTTKKAEQLPFDLGHREAFSREDFWVSSSNLEAVAWLDKYPDWLSPALIIQGPSACGKTHLLHVWQKEAGAVEFYENMLLSKTPVMIDDIERWIGDARTEEKLFHLYNKMKETGAHMLVAAKTPPVEWKFVLPDLKSRLMAAPVVAVSSPDDELLAVVLTKLFSDRQIFVSQEVVQYILPRIERSFDAVRTLVDKIDRKALADKKPVTIPLVREVL